MSSICSVIGNLLSLNYKLKHTSESTVYLEAQDRNNLIQEQLHTWGWVVASGTESPDVVFHHAVEVLLLEESKVCSYCWVL